MSRVTVEVKQSLCQSVLCCVNTGTYKLIFGSGIKLNVEASKSSQSGFYFKNLF